MALPFRANRYWLRETLYCNSQTPVFYLGEWWHLQSYRWDDGGVHSRGLPRGYTFEVCLINWACHEKKFQFHHDVECEPYIGRDHDGRNIEGVRIMPPHSDRDCDDRRFWMVLVRKSPGTVPTIAKSDEFKSEQAAVDAAEALARRAEPDHEYFTMECVARTRLTTITTERLRRC